MDASSVDSDAVGDLDRVGRRILVGVQDEDARRLHGTAHVELERSLGARAWQARLLEKNRYGHLSQLTVDDEPHGAGSCVATDHVDDRPGEGRALELGRGHEELTGETRVLRLGAGRLDGPER